MLSEVDKPGALLAWLIRQEQLQGPVTMIRNTSNQLVYSQAEIHNVFTAFYETLYTATTDATPSDIADLLDGLVLPRLTPEQALELESPVLEGEVRAAIGALANGKTPGPDGIPTEFYSAYLDTLAPKLTTLYNSSYERGILPPSLREALLVPIPKPGKDPSSPSSFRPLAILNVDYKILSKILATAFSTFSLYLSTLTNLASSLTGVLLLISDVSLKSLI